MAKRKKTALRNQKIAVGAAAVVIIAIFAYFFITTVAQAPGGKFVQGEQYQLLDHPGQPHNGKVQVTEFFSYACPHCYHFDPALNAWLQKNRKRVEFNRTPAVGTTEWRLFARAFYAMQALGILHKDHEKLFYAIHGQGLDLDSPAKLAHWFAENGTPAETFSAMLNSNAVTQQVERAQDTEENFRIDAVPSIVIDRKYLVQMSADVGPSRMLEVMDYLIDKELGSPSKQGTPTPHTSG